MKFYTNNYIILLAFLLLTIGCNLNFKRGNGNIISENIEPGDFSTVTIGGNYDVLLIKGNEPKVIIETDENLLPFINTEVYNQSLNINNVHQLKSTKGINIEIYYKEIDHIHSTGASNIEHEGILENNDLTIELSGIGAIELELFSKELHIDLTGAGVVTLWGEAELLETHISGAGGLRAFELMSTNCIINLSGLGGAEVTVMEKLEASITGVGGIVYAGNPEVIEKQITGFGKIKRAKEFIDDPNF